MATSKADGKRSLKEMTEDEDGAGGIGFGDDEMKKKGKRGSSAAGGSTLPACQVENCTADMTGAKRYHRGHKVCEFRAKAPMVPVAGLHQRFCQQCSSPFSMSSARPLSNGTAIMVILFFLLGVSAKHFMDEDSTTVSQNETTVSATLTSTSE